MSKLSLSRNSKILFATLGLIGLALALSFLQDYRAWNWRNVLGFSAVGFLTIYYLGLLFDNLTIDKEGFKYRSLGINYSGYWSDVNGVSNQKTILPSLGIVGIYISKSKLASGNNWIMAQELFVPISRFSSNWQESELRQRVNEFIAQAHQ